MSTNWNEAWTRLLGMVILAVAMAFAPFSTSHASATCDNLSNSYQLASNSHGDAAAVHKHPASSRLAAGLCCVSICSTYAANAFPSVFVVRLDFRSMTYDARSTIMAGQSVPPALDPPRLTV